MMTAQRATLAQGRSQISYFDLVFAECYVVGVKFDKSGIKVNFEGLQNYGARKVDNATSTEHSFNDTLVMQGI